MNVILWILFGAIAGWITAIILSDQYHKHYGIGAFVGILGGVIGGYLMQKLVQQADTSTLNLFSLVTAVAFALLMVVFFYNIHSDSSRHS